jgi:hypothetical protein
MTKREPRRRTITSPRSADETPTSDSAPDSIYVFGRQDESYLEMIKLSDYLYERRPVKTDTLKDQVESFLSKMKAVMEKAPEAFGAFQLDTIEISAEVSAKGHVSLLGSGGEAGGKGGIKFTLKRNGTRG